jgi:hypothetical protein
MQNERETTEKNCTGRRTVNRSDGAVVTKQNGTTFCRVVAKKQMLLHSEIYEPNSRNGSCF